MVKSLISYKENGGNEVKPDMSKRTNQILNKEKQWNDAALLLMAVNKLSFLN